MDERKFVILGPQGSGKGTQAQELGRWLGVPHISTGDIFRNLATQSGELAKTVADLLKAGALVPDDITNKLVAERLKEADTNGGFILDGYPRNMNQAKFLSRLYPTLRAIFISLTDDEAVSRLAGRLSCPACGAVYHNKFKPPKVGKVCDIDGAHLIVRTDDTEPVIRARLKTFHEQTEPILEFYRRQNKLLEVDGAPPIAEVTRQLRLKLQI